MKSWITKSGQKIVQVLSGRSNAFLIFSGEHCILVDCGRENNWNDLLLGLETMQLKEGALRALVLTHTHFDHVENACHIKERYKAQMIVHNSEAQYLADGKNAAIIGTLLHTRLLTIFFGKHAEKKNAYTPVPCDLTVDGFFDLAEMGFNAAIHHTPGHTDGSVSVVVDDEIALVGDLMFGRVPNSVFPPYAVNRRDMVLSWGKLLETGCTVFVPGHGAEISRELLEKQYNTYAKRFRI